MTHLFSAKLRLYRGMMGNMMFFRRKARLRAKAERLYSQIVKRARDISLYSTYQVEDSVDGRFDALILHVALVRRALASLGDEANEMISFLLETLVTDMDRSMREMGVGDLSVGKKVKTMMTAYKGREVAYDEALSGSDEDLKASLVRNLYRGQAPDHTVLDGLAARVRQDAQLLMDSAETIMANAALSWSVNDE